jgi:hypothetical protein
MPKEATSTKMGELKARLRNNMAMPKFKAWKASWALKRPSLSLNQAVGVGRPKLKPLEKATAFCEEGSPL